MRRRNRGPQAGDSAYLLEPHDDEAVILVEHDYGGRERAKLPDELSAHAA